MGKYKRVQSILSKAISVLVILVSLALVIVVWIFQDDVSSSAVTIFVEVDNIARVMRSGIARVEPELLALSDLIRQVETASEEIAQDVSDEGVVLRLLPQSVNDGLASTTQSLRENFVAVYDLLEATSDILLALDKMPFVNLPEKSLSTITTLQESMDEISGQVDTLQNNIIDLRSAVGARISQVSDTAAFLGEETDQFRSDLIQIDTDLESIQTQVRKYQRLAPPLILSAAIVFSLLSGWVVYSQVVMFLRSTNPEHSNNHQTAEKEDPSLAEENRS
jgi:hypothetical protein